MPIFNSLEERHLTLSGSPMCDPKQLEGRAMIFELVTSIMLKPFTTVDPPKPPQPRASSCTISNAEIFTDPEMSESKFRILKIQSFHTARDSVPDEPI